MPSVKLLLAVILVLTLEISCCASKAKSKRDDFYCRKDVCLGDRPHVGCDCGASYGRHCSGKEPHKVNLDEKLKKLILQQHNLCRNVIACGSVEPHAAAARMPEVTWDDDLEHLAWCNVRTCTYKHDQCRSTRAFHFAGQNIAQKTLCGTKVQLHPEETIKDAINAWFLEHRNTTPGMIDSYPEQSPPAPIGHFTVMINDKVRRIGCSLIQYRQHWPKHPHKTCVTHYFVCNYSHTNFVQQKTYTKSLEPVQNCSFYSDQYPCLCGTNEPDLPMKYWLH